MTWTKTKSKSVKGVKENAKKEQKKLKKIVKK
jgi:hypothetical protein